jgi:hypothetical protein
MVFFFGNPACYKHVHALINIVLSAVANLNRRRCVTYSCKARLFGSECGLSIQIFPFGWLVFRTVQCTFPRGGGGGGRGVEWHNSSTYFKLNHKHTIADPA